MLNRTRTFALVATATLALTACSGGTTDTDGEAADAPAAGGAVEFVGNDSVRWESTDLAATASEGAIDATLTCAGAVPHNIVVGGVNGDAVLAECGGNDSATFTLEAEAGTYTFWCGVPGHREAGMEGTLTVS